MLQGKFPIERARMRLRLTVPLDFQQDLMDCVDKHDADVEASDATANNFAITLLVSGCPGPPVLRALLAHACDVDSAPQ